MKVLVTGGAGYIGSVIAEELLGKGYGVVVLDNLQQGHKEAMPSGAEFILGDICDSEVLDKVFRQFKIDAVMHMAGETVVEYSITDPKRFFQNNIAGGINLLDAMLRHNVHRLIFSSSAAVYGEPQTNSIEEDHPKNPINSYGESKIMFERIIEWHRKAYGLKYISLRYFNAAGATRLRGEDHSPETHLIPIILKKALNHSGSVSIFGSDYPTRDGSCIRDYVHVVDIAGAHIQALEKLDSLSGNVYNLGHGGGYSVIEVIEMAKAVTGVNIPVIDAPRRFGDPATLVANSNRAKSELNWEPEFPELESIIKSAWRWMKLHTKGYTDTK